MKLRQSYKDLDTLVIASRQSRCYMERNDSSLDERTLSYNKEEEEESFMDEYTYYTDDLLQNIQNRTNQLMNGLTNVFYLEMKLPLLL